MKKSIRYGVTRKTCSRAQQSESRWAGGWAERRARTASAWVEAAAGAAALMCTRAGPRRACGVGSEARERGAVAEAGPGARHNARLSVAAPRYVNVALAPFLSCDSLSEATRARPLPQACREDRGVSDAAAAAESPLARALDVVRRRGACCSSLQATCLSGATPAPGRDRATVEFPRFSGQSSHSAALDSL
jgi:hypothetical protein